MVDPPMDVCGPQQGQVLAMGWTDKERLIVVNKDGKVALWTMQGEQLRQFDLPRECRDEGEPSLSNPLALTSYSPQG